MGTVALAGCSGGGAEPEPSSVDVDAAAPDDASLQATYTAETRSELPTDPPTIAEEGHKWVVVELEIENAEDNQATVGPTRFLLEADGSSYEFTSVGGEDWGLEETQLEAGDTATGSVVFHVPEDVTAATLTTRESENRAGVSFRSG